MICSLSRVASAQFVAQGLTAKNNIWLLTIVIKLVKFVGYFVPRVIKVLGILRIIQPYSIEPLYTSLRDKQT